VGYFKICEIVWFVILNAVWCLNLKTTIACLVWSGAAMGRINKWSYECEIIHGWW